MLVALALDAWAFRAATGTGYFDWYLRNGSLIGLATSLVTVGWGDLNRNPDLISPHPAKYLSTQLHIGGIAFLAIAGALARGREAGSPVRSGEILLALLVVIPFAAVILLWMLLVVPVQYGVYLVCGAPVRLAASAATRPVARLDARRMLASDDIARGAPLPPGAWEAGIDQKPVTTTALIGAAALLLLNLWRPGFLAPLLAL